MPELPEVEIVRIGLQELIVGKEIKGATTDNLKSFPNAKDQVDQFLVGSTILAVRRRAKVLLIDLDSGYSLMIHLRMTGQLVYVPLEQTQTRNIKGKSRGVGRFGAGHPNDSLVGKLPDKSTRVTFEFSDKSKLYFNDQRKFGWVKLPPTELVAEDPFMKKVGPEPLGSDMPNKIFIQRIRKRNGTTVKAAILDQTTLAGVGNIYADESLWSARIHPSEKVKNISDGKLEILRNEIINVMKLSIQKGGSTSRNYVNAKGMKGSYLSFAKVFKREGMPCFTCGNTIVKLRVAGRGTPCMQHLPDYEWYY